MLQKPRASNTACACTVFILSALALPVQADTWDKKTTITISQAVEFPGAVLQPGKYVLKLVDNQSNRHIVQVMNTEEDHVYTTVLAIPNERLRPSGKTILSYYETPAGQPPAVRAWFYPGDVIGEEFAYPKTRAGEISKSTNMNVPIAPDNLPSPPTSASSSDTKPIPPPVTAATAPVVQENPGAAPEPAIAQSRPPAPEPTAAPAVTPQPPARSDTDMSARSSSRTQPQMPHTASNLPLLGLLGFGSLALAASLRLVRRHSA